MTPLQARLALCVALSIEATRAREAAVGD